MTPKIHKLGFLAEFLDAQLIGDGEYEIDSLAALENADEKSLSFLASGKFLPQLRRTRAGAVILRPEDVDEYIGHRLIISDPYQCYARLSRLFDTRQKQQSGIHESAVVSKTATVSASASVGANCFVGDNVVVGENTEIYPGTYIGEDTRIGDNCLVYPNVSIYAGVTIGHRVTIHSGTVIGSDGFGFAPSKNGWIKIHQLGGVRIGDDVEIGSSTTIDRGALMDTVIESGVIIDNQVHLAHNVRVGSGTAIAGCVGVAGSTIIGKNCTLGGAVAMSGHLTIADNSHFNGGTVVTKSTTESGGYASAPLQHEVKKWRRNSIRYTQLDEWVNRIKALEKRLENLKKT